MKRALAWLLPVGPAVWIAVGLHAALGLALCFVPLFDLLGYEFSAAQALLASLTAGPLVLSILRRARSAEAALDLGRVARRALAWLGLCLLGPLVFSLLNSLRVKNCNLTEGLVFFLLLPGLSALLAASWGLTLGLLVRRRWLAGGMYALVWLGLAGRALWEVWAGLQVDSYNPLVGWVAGPVYEEVVRPELALVGSRLLDLAWTLALLVGAALRAGVRARRALPWLLACLAAGAGLWLGGDRLGFRRSEAALEAAMGGQTRSRHFVIHHPPGLAPGAVRRLALDCEFRLHQIERALGPLEKPELQAWFFPDAQAKRQFTGAAGTQFAKPWLGLMALNGVETPHPTLHHELVHAATGNLGAWPFGASARGALWVNPGLTEGLAVALDWPVGQLDPHAWSAAMRRIGKAPEVAALFGPVGFWSAASNRSYTLAGSLVRFLLERHGPEKLRAAYAAGELETAYGAPLAELVGAWETFLDGLELSETVLEAARARFAQGSVFQRVCAHEVAALRQAAARSLARDPARTLALADRILTHLPDDLGARELRLEALARSDRPREALAEGEALRARPELREPDRLRLLGRLADLETELGDPDGARARLQAILASPLAPDEGQRAASIKLEALERGPAGAPVGAYLARGRPDAASLLALREAAAAEPGWASVWYLLGRALWNQAEAGQALPYLAAATRLGLGHPALQAENLRLLALAGHRCAGRDGLALAAAAAWVLWLQARTPGDEAWALDMFDRVLFEAGWPG
jgi:hypothetical protein